jgi:hypothetical protein
LTAPAVKRSLLNVGRIVSPSGNERASTGFFEIQKKGLTVSPVPVLQIRHDEKDAWWVAAKWPSGQTEDIRGFSSEAEANAWIANELQAWLDKRAAEAVSSDVTRELP